MRAVIRDSWGGPEVVRLADLPEPVPSPGQVRIAVDAASVNAFDWHQVTGTPEIMRFPTQLRRPRRRILGIDVAGTVTALGEGVTDLTPGDRVLGLARGSFADVVVAAADAVVRAEPGVEPGAAAALPLAGLTALQALRRTDVGPESRVLVIGAGGGVGSLAVQIARHLGAAHVAALTRTSTLALVADLGADETLDSTKVDPATLRGRFDAVLDLSGTWRMRDLRGSLRPDGVAVLVGLRSSSGAVVEPVRRLIGPIPRSRRGTTVLPFLADESRDDLAELAALLASGAVRPVLDDQLPLERAAEALARVGAGSVRGKIVLRVR